MASKAKKEANMKEIELLLKELKNLETQSAEFSLVFYNKPHMRCMLFSDILHSSVARLFPSAQSIDDLYRRYDLTYNRLVDRHWDNQYQCHDVHFHKTFEDWLSCPFTCLQEVIDFLEKICKPS